MWAFGCVLYELLTGRMAFAGATVPDTLSAVLHREPDWAALPAGVPPAVTTLLRRCLEKDVRQRRRDIGDVRAELDDALAQPGRGHAASCRRRARAARRLLPLALAAAAVIAAAALGAWASRWRLARAGGPEDPPTRVSSESPTLSAWRRCRRSRLTARTWRSWRPSTAGARSGSAGSRGGHALQITHDDVDHDHPRWTPDSSAIVYFTPAQKEGEAGMLWEIPALGGTPRRLAASLTGADVSHDGRLARDISEDRRPAWPWRSLPAMA